MSDIKPLRVRDKTYTGHCGKSLCDSMRRESRRRFVQFVLLMTLLWVNAGVTQAQTAAFTYQGKLIDAGSPATGTYDLQFKLFDALSGGSQIGAAVTLEDVAVSSGIFTTTLDFGSAAFPGATRFLEIGARPGASTGAFTLLTPRQPVSSTPYSIRSQAATNADALSPSCVGCVTAPQIANAQVVKSLNGLFDSVTLSAGGNITLTSSGNTLTIAAPGALSSIAHDATLAGSGTSGSPLKAAVPFQLSGNSGGPILSSSNNGIGEGLVGTSSGGNGVSGTGAFGVYGSGTVGVFGTNSGSGTGVQGFSSTGTGVLGQSSSSDGVSGTGFRGVVGTGTIGVYGTSSSGIAVNGFSSSGTGVLGQSTSSIGVYGVTGSTSFNIAGVLGEATANSGTVVGVYGKANNDPNGTGVAGFGKSAGGYFNATGNVGTGVGVYGIGDKSGVQGDSGSGAGVYGATSSTAFNAAGVLGEATASSGQVVGVYGRAQSDPNGTGVAGFGNSTGGYFKATGNNPTDVGVYGISLGDGVVGQSAMTVGVSGTGPLTGVSGIGAIGVKGQGSSVAIFGHATNIFALAGKFEGNVEITGNLSKGGGSFKIDHPLDPENKYLSHSFVESPDMKNIYDGNITTDSNGDATVTLPDYFEALNRDFRYQLTVIGQFAQAIVATKIKRNRFTIKTSAPNVEVSWQVTGVRQDAYANAHRIKVEEDKPEKQRGSYLHPDVFGQPAEKNVQCVLHQKPTQLLKEKQE